MGLEAKSREENGSFEVTVKACKHAGSIFSAKQVYLGCVQNDKAEPLQPSTEKRKAS